MAKIPFFNLRAVSYGERILTIDDQRNSTENFFDRAFGWILLRQEERDCRCHISRQTPITMASGCNDKISFYTIHTVAITAATFRVWHVKKASPWRH